MSTSVKVLIVEDDAALAAALGVAVRRAGGAPLTVHSAGRASAALDANGLDIGLMILDIGLPDRNGFDLLRERTANNSFVPPVLILTAHGALENAIEARRLGVLDFLEKPVDLAALQPILTNALQWIQEQAEAPPQGPAPLTYVGAADSMRPVFQGIAQACVSYSPILIEGETGTGKTTTANLIFRNDPRGLEPFRLLATGADAGSIRDVLTADMPSGLLLEEVSGLSGDLQETLVNRIETAEAKTRIIATSTMPLWPLVRDGSFSAALYYRLQPGRIVLPALRDRLSDLPALAAWFLGELRPGVAFRLKASALRALEHHSWPGNVRELRNALAWACLSTGAKLGIDVEDLPPEIRGEASPLSGSESADEQITDSLRRWLDERLHEQPDLAYDVLLDDLERALLRDLLRRHHFKPSRLATERGLNRSTLRKRLQELDITSRGRD